MLFLKEDERREPESGGLELLFAFQKKVRGSEVRGGVVEGERGNFLLSLVAHCPPLLSFFPFLQNNLRLEKLN